MNGIDWLDVAAHAGAAFIAGAAAAFLPWDAMLAAFIDSRAWLLLPLGVSTIIITVLKGGMLLFCLENAWFWHMREAGQRHTKGQPYSHTWTGRQVAWEWLAPSVTCVLGWDFVIIIT